MQNRQPSIAFRRFRTRRCWSFFFLVVFIHAVPVLSGTRQLIALRGADSTQDESSTLSNRIGDVSIISANITVPLHAHSGSHHIHVYIGSPPQRQTLIVDTGSRAMAFPCKPCRSCGNHASPYFDASRSTTLRTSKCGSCLLEGISTCSLFGDQCEINQKYTEGSSWSANEVEDMVWLGTPDVVESIEEHMQLAVPYAFGCQTSIKGLFQKQYADGILGLARHDTSIVTAYHQAQAIPRNSFSLCLTMDAGHLSLGGSMPKRHHQVPMRMTPVTREDGWYSIEVINVLVGDVEVTPKDKNMSLLRKINGGKGCILDSGTTDTYLPAALAKRFGKASMMWSDGLTDFSENARQKSYSYDEFMRLPQITFVLSYNVTLTMEPKYYMEGVPINSSDAVQTWKDTKILTNRVYLEEEEGAVLGANAMFGYDILFDSQAHQIGIAKADCAASIRTSIS